MSKWTIPPIDWYVYRRPENLGSTVIYAGNKQVHLTTVMKQEVRAEGAYREPSLVIPDEAAQQLMNGLWHAGFRPNDGAGTLANIESLKSHLDDLRTIAFHALKIPLSVSP